MAPISTVSNITSIELTSDASIRNHGITLLGEGKTKTKSPKKDASHTAAGGATKGKGEGEGDLDPKVKEACKKGFAECKKYILKLLKDNKNHSGLPKLSKDQKNANVEACRKWLKEKGNEKKNIKADCLDEKQAEAMAKKITGGSGWEIFVIIGAAAALLIILILVFFCCCSGKGGKSGKGRSGKSTKKSSRKSGKSKSSKKGSKKGSKKSSKKK